jgi:hypothetical protein
MSERSEYLERFFAEKALPEMVFVYRRTDAEGMTHIIEITNEEVIERIKHAPRKEQEKVIKILRQIDFRNGDVNHFLEHLGNALADQTVQSWTEKVINIH